MVINKFAEAIALVFNLETFAIILLALLISVVFGALPGLGGSIAMALFLPLTLIFEGHQALIFLIMIYNGAMYGGSISAILMNVPGTSAAAASTLDGYPLTKQGRSYEALVLSALSSGVGGIFADILAIGLIFLIIPIILFLSTSDIFLITLLGITLIAFVSEGSVIKGILAGMFGLLISTIGIAPGIPNLRYTFGFLNLYDGLSFLAILIGVFALAEMLQLISSGTETISEVEVKSTMSRMELIRYYFRQRATIIKSTIIGLVVGAIPGSGAAVSNFAAYAEQVRSDSGTTDDAESDYGDGNRKGLIAAEGANNSTVDGSVLPTIAFGIPGSGATALLLGGMILHGFVPGPSMIDENLSVTISIFIALFVGSVVILFFGIVFVTKLDILTKIKIDYIIPFVVVLGFYGTYAYRLNMVDILVVFAFGLLGFYMKQYNYSIIALIIGVILGPIAERNFIRALQIGDGSYISIIDSPFSFILFVLVITVVVSSTIGPVILRHLRSYRP
jgi:putative tricarboxylic transport membrane protein